MSAARDMTSREKTLATVVGVVVFILLNLVLFDFVFKKQARLRADIATRTSEWNNIQTLFNQRDLWVKRDQWLTEKQPKLTNESAAGVQLLDEIKAIAKECEVALENPAIVTVTKVDTGRSVPVTMELKGTWPALVKFLHTLQQPEKFIVIENATMQVDPEDKSQLRGSFRIAKWYAQ